MKLGVTRLYKYNTYYKQGVRAMPSLRFVKTRGITIRVPFRTRHVLGVLLCYINHVLNSKHLKKLLTASPGKYLLSYYLKTPCRVGAAKLLSYWNINHHQYPSKLSFHSTRIVLLSQSHDVANSNVMKYGATPTHYNWFGLELASVEL